MAASSTPRIRLVGPAVMRVELRLDLASAGVYEGDGGWMFAVEQDGKPAFINVEQLAKALGLDQERGDSIVIASHDGKLVHRRYGK